MTLQDEIENQRAGTTPGTPITPPLAPAPAEWPLCPCGAKVDADLLELRDLFPALSPDLCTACYEVASREDDERCRTMAENAAHRHRLAELERVVPAEMLATDLGHRTFNAALWVSVAGWTVDSGRWLLITGTPGLCKTRVAGLLAKRLILDGVRVRWMTAFDLQAAVEDLHTYSRAEDALRAEARQRLREWRNAEVLVIDDLGKNTWNDRLEAKLFELVDSRKSGLRPTIVTANSRLTELLPLLSRERGGPIIGRILEASAGWQFEAKPISPR